MRVRFTQDYESSVGTWRKGEVIEVDATFAAWLMRDAGVEEVTDPDPQPRQQPAAKNRQVTTPKRTRAKASNA